MPTATRKDMWGAIDEAIRDSSRAWEQLVDDNRSPADNDPQRRPLAMKYMPSEWAKTYRGPNLGLWMGEKDYTWGRAVYVTGVQEPLSTAIYGRVGLVGYFEPTPDWRVFDARDDDKADLYLEWLQLQSAYHDAILTVYSNHWLHGLRNDFREEFGIDVVLCNADENDELKQYTHDNDTWLCVSDWTATSPQWPDKRELSRGHSTVFKDVRITVAPEEDFISIADPTKVRPPNDPPPRKPQLTLSGNPPALSPSDVVQAYWNHRIIRVES